MKEFYHEPHKPHELVIYHVHIVRVGSCWFVVKISESSFAFSASLREENFDNFFRKGVK